MQQLKVKELKEFIILKSLEKEKKRFSEIRNDTNLYDYVICKVLRRLESKKLIVRFVDINARPPTVCYQITNEGLKALKEYQLSLLQLLKLNDKAREKVLELL
ncbi:MAG: winged helix-turn-helix transcriptional regulator [Archaeoglobaceae archaeon]|nr:winged helix-turn-helix transcriptional regulator [Archaeoglobaceae archaeon]